MFQKQKTLNKFLITITFSSAFISLYVFQTNLLYSFALINITKQVNPGDRELVMIDEQLEN